MPPNPLHHRFEQAWSKLAHENREYLDGLGGLERGNSRGAKIPHLRARIFGEHVEQLAVDVSRIEQLASYIPQVYRMFGIHAGNACIARLADFPGRAVCGHGTEGLSQQINDVLLHRFVQSFFIDEVMHDQSVGHACGLRHLANSRVGFALGCIKFKGGIADPGLGREVRVRSGSSIFHSAIPNSHIDQSYSILYIWSIMRVKMSDPLKGAHANDGSGRPGAPHPKQPLDTPSSLGDPMTSSPNLDPFEGLSEE